MNSENNNRIDVRLSEKYLLTVKEAASYFGIGEHRIRDIVDDNPEKMIGIFCGNKKLINRKRMEEYIDNLHVV
ncbi:MAG: hypothetical protein IJ788_05800 [Oscillospiraceae bacterium]|nr:hypothetical protein [Oscillospiraceae bacterium]